MARLFGQKLSEAWVSKCWSIRSRPAAG